MLLEESEVLERMESPANLLNRLRSGLSKPNKTNIISIPSSAELIEDIEDKLTNGSMKSKAAAIMNSCLDELKVRVTEIRPEKLATVVAEMNKVVTAQEEKNKKDDNHSPQVIVYAPSFIKEENFETIYVKE